jgi:hypothetical protein
MVDKSGGALENLIAFHAAQDSLDQKEQEKNYRKLFHENPDFKLLKKLQAINRIVSNFMGNQLKKRRERLGSCQIDDNFTHRQEEFKSLQKTQNYIDQRLKDIKKLVEGIAFDRNQPEKRKKFYYNFLTEDFEKAKTSYDEMTKKHQGIEEERAKFKAHMD